MAELEAADTTKGRKAELVERLRFTSGVTDACQLLLEAVLSSEDEVERAEDALRGAAYGVGEERFQGFLRSRGGEAVQLREAMDGGSPARLYPEGDLDSLGLGVATVVPFPGPRGIPAGAVVLEGIVSE